MFNFIKKLIATGKNKNEYVIINKTNWNPVVFNDQ